MEGFKHMAKKQGYAITTCCFRLRCKHPEWLEETQKFYNQIQKFYYDLYLEHPELWKENSQNSLRGVEMLSIPGRSGNQVKCPLPWEHVLLYFRRAAANAGIAAAKSYLARSENGYVGAPASLNSAATYYKGMYRDLTSYEVTLRVWDGSTWKWMRCRLYGNTFPQEAQIMSPSVVFEKPYVMLHVPVKEVVTDASGVKDRIAEDRNVCGIQFANKDTFAAASVMNAQKEELAVHFFKGGKEYSHQCAKVVQQIDRSYDSHGEKAGGQVNRKYWMHLKHLNAHYAHKVSREMIDFCKANEVGIIAFPKYVEDYANYVRKGAGNYSALHLSTKIREYLTYKAWKEGILVIDVNAKGMHEICAVCGKKIINTDKKAQECVCEDGHRTNRYLNVARNTAKRCLKQFQKKSGK